MLKAGAGDSYSIYSARESVLGREAELKITLEPGSYVIVPRTSGCIMSYPRATGSDCADLIDEEHGGIPSSLYISTIKDLFRKYDLRVSQGLSHIEFSNLLKDVGEPEINEADFNTLLS